MGACELWPGKHYLASMSSWQASVFMSSYYGEEKENMCTCCVRRTYVVSTRYIASRVRGSGTKCECDRMQLVHCWNVLKNTTFLLTSWDCSMLTGSFKKTVFAVVVLKKINNQKLWMRLCGGIARVEQPLRQLIRKTCSAVQCPMPRLQRRGEALCSHAQGVWGRSATLEIPSWFPPCLPQLQPALH